MAGGRRGTVVPLSPLPFLMSSASEPTPIVRRLHLVARAGKVDSIKQALAMAADVNALCEYDNAPLTMAISGGHLLACNYLIEQKADVNHPSPSKGPDAGDSKTTSNPSTQGTDPAANSSAAAGAKSSAAADSNQRASQSSIEGESESGEASLLVALLIAFFPVAVESQPRSGSIRLCRVS